LKAPSPPLAVIFDWDGVVIDSHRQHEESWYRMAAINGLSVPENFFKRSFGMRNPEVIRDLAGWTHDPVMIQKLAEQKELIYRQIIKEKGIEPIKGIPEFLVQLKQSHIPTAIGSSSVLENITTVIEVIKLPTCFDVIVTGADVKRGKPDPEVFLKCAERLNASPNCCIVFEDAHVGIQAAKTAGMTAIAVATTHPRHTFQEADYVIDNFLQLNIEKILSVPSTLENRFSIR
jgi:beta-phosphoglucomutase family hydrolase